MISPVLRPKLWAALLGAIAAAVLATPAYAEPGAADHRAGHRLRARRSPARSSCPAAHRSPACPPPPVVNIGNGPLAAADLRR